jgi:hypothetical protein
MTIDYTAIAYQLKRVYGDKITELFNRQTMTYNMFMKSKRQASVQPGGEGFYFSVRTTDIESIGGRAENAYLPEPMATAGVQGYIQPKLIYATLRLSGLAVEAGKSNLMAFAQTQGDAIANVYKALIVDLNRQCWGDGTGLLGTLSAAATPSTSATWTGTFSNDRGVRYMRPGMICDFYNGTAIDQSASSVRISSINPVTKVVTFEKAANSYRAYHPLTAAQSYSNAASSIASGSYLVRYGERAAAHVATTTYELMGLNGIFDDGTVHSTFENIVTSTYANFKANILGNSSVNRELSIDLMLQAMDLCSTRSDESIDTFIMGLGQRRKYFALLSPDVRYAPGVFLGGYEKLSFAQNSQVNLVFDPHCQPNRIYGLPDGIIKKYELTPIGWGGMDGQKMHWRENYDQATAFLRTYTNLGVEKRNALVLMDDLTEPAATAW